MPKRFLAFLTLAGLLALFSAPSGLACGDKFIMGPSASQLDRVRPAKHPARILIYADPSTATGTAMQDPGLEETLKEAGHSLEAADSARALETALSTHEFDLILADYRNAADVRGLVKVKAPTTRVVPVLDREGRQSLSAARREFGAVLNIPASVGSVLNVIDKAMSPA